MAGPNDGSAANDLIGNETKVREDLQKVMKYVKEELFLKVIDIWDQDDLKVNGKLYKDFMKRCKTEVTGLKKDEPYSLRLF